MRNSCVKIYLSCLLLQHSRSVNSVMRALEGSLHHTTIAEVMVHLAKNFPGCVDSDIRRKATKRSIGRNTLEPKAVNWGL